MLPQIMVVFFCFWDPERRGSATECLSTLGDEKGLSVTNVMKERPK